MGVALVFPHFFPLSQCFGAVSVMYDVQNKSGICPRRSPTSAYVSLHGTTAVVDINYHLVCSSSHIFLLPSNTGQVILAHFETIGALTGIHSMLAWDKSKALAELLIHMASLLSSRLNAELNPKQYLLVNIKRNDKDRIVSVTIMQCRKFVFGESLQLGWSEIIRRIRAYSNRWSNKFMAWFWFISSKLVSEIEKIDRSQLFSFLLEPED